MLSRTIILISMEKITHRLHWHGSFGKPFTTAAWREENKDWLPWPKEMKKQISLYMKLNYAMTFHKFNENQSSNNGTKSILINYTAGHVCSMMKITVSHLPLIKKWHIWILRVDINIHSLCKNRDLNMKLGHQQIKNEWADHKKNM